MTDQPEPSRDDSAPADSDQAVDPVCGMTVSRSEAAASVEHQGRTYHFCCPGCAGKFRNDPGRYLDADRPGASASQHRESDAGDRAASQSDRGTYTCPMHPEVEQQGPGSCPKCGMALERKSPAGGEDDEEDPELKDMTRRFWVGAALTLPVLILAMGPMLGLPVDAWIGHGPANWLELIFATPVVLWAGWPLLVRGYRSFATWNLNMFSLISIGVAAAWGYSVIATLAPGIFPGSFRNEAGEVGVYFEAAAVIVTLVLLGQMLELRARQRCTSARAGSPVTHWLSPDASAVRPSRLIASFTRIHGRPVVMRLTNPMFCARAPAPTPSIRSTAIPAASSAAMPCPPTRGSGSRMAKTTRAIPASIRASARRAARRSTSCSRTSASRAATWRSRSAPTTGRSRPSRTSSPRCGSRSRA